MGGTRRVYPPELKRNALELVKTSGKTASAVARDLGIDPGLLCHWIRDGNVGEGIKAFPGHGNPRDEELARLQKENVDLRETNEILKKVVAIFSVKDPKK